MKKYYVQNGIIIVNKYAVKYSMSQDLGNTETASEITQYFSDDLALGGLVSELERKNIEFELIEFDVSNILKYNGVSVSSEEEARRLVEPNLEEVIYDKIKEISEACRQTIYNGIDVELKDGSIKHFSLKIEDQININVLLNRMNLEDTHEEAFIPYHADGELCALFSYDDFNTVAESAAAFILKQTTYCNHLTAYIKTLETKEEIEAIQYGFELAGEFLTSYNRIINI